MASVRSIRMIETAYGERWYHCHKVKKRRDNCIEWKKGERTNRWERSHLLTKMDYECRREMSISTRRNFQIRGTSCKVLPSCMLIKENSCGKCSKSARKQITKRHAKSSFGRCCWLADGYGLSSPSRHISQEEELLCGWSRGGVCPSWTISFDKWGIWIYTIAEMRKWIIKGSLL